ncbi:MAG: general secretion pathway protein GspB [Gammaproteobacteria bacterium]|nr:MAG: general secretion pathway protein GspB [Gammaproteobacteria bacterium]
MSYILEALKKADQERMVGNVPDLDASHDSGISASRRKTAWFWILGVLVVVNGILVSVLLLRNDGTDDGTTSLSADSRTIAEVEQPAAPDTNSTRSRVAPRQYRRPQVQAYIPPAAKPAPVIVPDAPPVTPAPVETRATVPEPVEKTADAATGQAAPVSTPVPASALPQPSAATAQPQTGATSGIPDWDDLSLEFRGGFTVPRIDVHVYDSNPQLRFILADLKKYREGDRLENGAMLEKITPEGVQFSFQGTQFIYRP